MKAYVILCCWLMIGSSCLAQNIRVTFTGTGASALIDSVTATNLTTGKGIVMPGNEVLTLTGNTGIAPGHELSVVGKVYPNPFSGHTTFTLSVDQPQAIDMKVQNLFGQVVAQAKTFAQSGENEFVLAVKNAGIYIISLGTQQGRYGYRVICAEADVAGNSIHYVGSSSDPVTNVIRGSSSLIKSSPFGNSLGYTPGDIVLYSCTSGFYKTILTDSPEESKNYQVEFVYCTDANGGKYPVVHIGSQTWMAGNLAFLPSVHPPSDGSEVADRYYVYGYEGNSVIDAKRKPDYLSYGSLYNWEAAKTACPSGWYLPSDEDMTILTDYLGTPAGGRMKESGYSHWSTPNTGATNKSGFTALPGGFRSYDGRFDNHGIYGLFWTSTGKGTSDAWYRGLSFDSDGAGRGSYYKTSGFSVRCLKDRFSKVIPYASFTVSPAGGTTSTIFQFDASASSDAETPAADLEIRWDWNGDGTWDTEFDTTKITFYQFSKAGNFSVRLEVKDSDGFTDTYTHLLLVEETLFPNTFIDNRDGRSYKYVTIGTQTWMAQNLAFLPAVSPSNIGSDSEKKYYVSGYEGNNVSQAKAAASYSAYGVLYNWLAAMDGASASNAVPSGVQGICPGGWHLPSDKEWTILTEYLVANGYGFDGSGNDIGKSLADSTGWISSNLVGTVGNDLPGNNSSGFSALPGGNRYYNGGFGYPGYDAYFWSATEADSLGAWDRDLYYTNDGVYRGYYYKSRGFSVRCLRN